ncbi:hypothetical protein SAMN05660865_00069 [Caloramator fervidus]|uniref:Uncharacterized protein n=1 Tax=Caloramator fervidus TaxID=29344 RepID=A0A1H5RKC7_9CLOT|nr:hypothetical protein [Caloramator fervidus]SEF38793.1 hypothetical protein SAMN05660865_00069 [Caloramator fervidus]
MFIDPKFKIALKCKECGKFKVFDIDLFKEKLGSFHCDCKNNILNYGIKGANIILEADCVFCNKKHRLKFKVRDIIEKPLKIINCPFTDFEIIFAGKNNSVDDIISKYESDMIELLKLLGFDIQVNLRRF